MTRGKCRLPGCDNEPRDDGKDPFENRFCSVSHELKYEHIKDDAEDARRAEAQEAREDSAHRPTGP